MLRELADWWNGSWFVRINGMLVVVGVVFILFGS
jgi:hypothetical protein